ncbi:late competence development ComFB family protein [Marinobacter sp. SS21]|uniref:late competence development ComFB family protein n=1 Tax=Marinobacter sp. SS21 TaxID=2979460 RepID=UPI00232D1FEF|nr:late competence development ComFB family protein [Marinobacter sp. SS21]MDC0664256.1 late competence development ComFB family protein [Marinobacter sp. SS21]
MSLLDAIDNFYERLVAEAIDEARQPEDTEDFLADVICVALNRLPPRYYRHAIDMRFYLPDQELDEMKQKVRVEVAQARDYVLRRQRGDEC